jgi:hypothetical protein
MNSSKLVIKLYADDFLADLDVKDVVPVFHSWIQRRAIDDHLLIDVADYAHVPDGPGAVLVAHEANYSLDRFARRLGLSYSRKRPLEGSFAEKLRFVFIAAMEAAARLEEDPALACRLSFRTDQLTFRINDRLLGPNTSETYEQVRPELERFFGELYGEGASVQLDHLPDAPCLFEVKISVTGAAAVSDVNSLLARLGSAQLASD